MEKLKLILEYKLFSDILNDIRFQDSKLIKNKIKHFKSLTGFHNELIELTALNDGIMIKFVYVDEDNIVKLRYYKFGMMQKCSSTKEKFNAKLLNNVTTTTTTPSSNSNRSGKNRLTSNTSRKSNQNKPSYFKIKEKRNQKFFIMGNEKITDHLTCVNKATKCYNNKNYDLAIEFLKASLEFKANCHHCLHLMGNTFMKKGDYLQAIEYLNKALTVCPTHLDSFISKGIIFSNMGDYIAACNEFTAVIKKDFSNFNAYFQRALIYMKMSRYAEAFDDYNNAIKINGTIEYSSKLKAAYINDIERLISNINSFIKKDNFEDAFKLYNKVKEILKFNFLGLSSTFYKKISGNIQYANQIIELKRNLISYPGRHEDHHSLVMLYNSAANYIKSLEHIDKAILLNHKNPDYYFTRHQIRVKLHDYDNALKDLDDAINMNNSEPLYYIHRYKFYLMNSIYKDALNDMATIAKLAPDKTGEITNDLNNFLKLYYENAVNCISNCEFDQANKKLIFIIDQLNTHKILASISDKQLYNNVLSYHGIIQNLFSLSEKIEVCPSNHELYLKRGDIYFELKLYKYALKDFNIAVKSINDVHNKITTVKNILLNKTRRSSNLSIIEAQLKEPHPWI